MMKKILGSVLFLSVTTSCLIFSSCTKKPEDVIKEYEAAFNAHDTNKLASLFSGDAVIELSGLNKLTGRGQIKSYAEYDSVLNSSISISDITSSDEKSFFVMTLKNDLFRTIGIDTAKFSMIFKISGGKIQEISGRTTPETDKKIQQFRDPFMLWAAKEKLDVLNEIMPEGNMVYNAANAKKYSELVLEWKKTNSAAQIKPEEKKIKPHW